MLDRKKSYWLSWYPPINPALRRLRQKDLKFQASQGYLGSPCLKQANKTKQKKLYILIPLPLQTFLIWGSQFTSFSIAYTSTNCSYDYFYWF
jgi:hypothetical protein